MWLYEWHARDFQIMKKISWSVSEAPRVLEELPALVCNYPHDTLEIVWEGSETAMAIW